MMHTPLFCRMCFRYLQKHYKYRIPVFFKQPEKKPKGYPNSDHMVV